MEILIPLMGHSSNDEAMTSSIRCSMSTESVQKSSTKKESCQAIMKSPMPKITILKSGNAGAKFNSAAEKLTHLASQKHLLCFT